MSLDDKIVFTAIGVATVSLILKHEWNESKDIGNLPPNYFKSNEISNKVLRRFFYDQFTLLNARLFKLTDAYYSNATIHRSTQKSTIAYLDENSKLHTTASVTDNYLLPEECWVSTEREFFDIRARGLELIIHPDTEFLQRVENMLQYHTYPYEQIYGKDEDTTISFLVRKR